MNSDIPKLLEQLWRQKAGVTPAGSVTYQPKGELALRDLRKAFGEIGSLMVVRLDAIGDNFIFLDSYRKLRRLFPKTNIVVVTYSENKPIYDRNPFVNRTLYVDRNA